MLDFLFIGLWVLALYGYLVVFAAFLLSDGRNHLTRQFRIQAFLYLAWALASLCMELEINPGTVFWYRIKQIAVCLIPCSIYLSLKLITGKSCRGWDTLLIVSSGILLAVPVFWDGYFLPVMGSAAEMAGIGISSISGNMHFQPRLLLLLPVIMLSSIGFYSVYILASDSRMTYQRSLMIGVIAFWLGALLDIILDSAFPFDLLGGLLNTIILLYIVSKERLVSLNLFVKKGATEILGTLTFLLVFVFLCSMHWGRYEDMKDEAFYLVMASSIATSLMVFMYNILSDRFYFNRRDYLVGRGAQYNREVISNVGSLEELRKSFRNVLRDMYGDIDIVMYERSEKDDGFILVEDTTSSACPAIDAENPILDEIRRLDGMTDIKVLAGKYPELGISGEGRKLSFIIPLFCRGELMGFAFVGKIGSSSDMDILYSIADTSAIAIDDTHFRHRLAHDAEYEYRTQLLNHHEMDRIVMRKMREDVEWTFMVFSINDVELFRTVYSLDEGDILDRIFADCLRNSAGSSVIPGLVNSDIFCAVLDGGAREAILFDDDVRRRFRNANAGTIREDLTFSTGIVEVNRDDLLEPNILLNLAISALVIAGEEGDGRRRVFERGMENDPIYKEAEFAIRTATAIARALDLRDHFTYAHSNNVADMGRILAKAVGLSPMDQHIVYEAGLIHDIGKISIPDSILLNTGRLTDDEYAVMKSHVERATETISSVPHGFRILPIVLGHHERWDGRGYPKGLKGDEIPLGGRCLAIADAFDAMISKRVYKDPMPIEKALEEILRCSGTQFDPELGPLFVEMVRDGRIVPSPYIPEETSER